ncbi:hypothetical protein JWH16_04555 [Xanthomonas campestris pv. campestris]|uniref:hypothetical protein n=1 Tax=Xanthomonas campestris TaxID=339 RepID=UPI001E5F8C90|nr:hypothetical protein [Xanthomonas campestris]MCD0253126.1 hypothetical protein [Xanthomonas campestris pv. campestris]
MAVYDFSYTTIDPQGGQARTFRITTDSRRLAFIEIRCSVLKVNRARLGDGGSKLLAVPAAAEDLHATQPHNCQQLHGRVALYA